MFHVVKGRVEQEVFGPGSDDFADLIAAFVQTAPNGHLRGHIRIFIADAKPLPQPLFRAGPVVVHREIDPLGES